MQTRNKHPATSNSSSKNEDWVHTYVQRRRGGRWWLDLNSGGFCWWLVGGRWWLSGGFCWWLVGGRWWLGGGF